MILPNHPKIPVNLLAACFNNTSATYKYYWLLSILQSVEYGKFIIPKRELFAGMISNAWYTINYFHISFGKQDKLQRAIETIKDSETIPIDDKREKIYQRLIETNNYETISQLLYFNNQVPHWFLSPWFPNMDKSEIFRGSKNFNNQCLYSLNDASIEINPEWIRYLEDNSRLIKDFCYWNLAMYLQSKNPSVPDIPNKLIRPAVRNSLTRQRTQFWDMVLREVGTINCIYTNKKLLIGNYAVEHFIPYSFVSHDLIWNLIPADKSFNSAKNDKLPPLEKYFDPFYKLQEAAFEIIKSSYPKNRFLEDYLTIFPTLNFRKDKFREVLQPLITIASNNGFEFLCESNNSFNNYH